MGKQRTIFDLFRQQDGNFSSEPSNDAWSKLERKLDGKKEIKPVRRINWWAMAAGLMVLVGAVSVLQLSISKTMNSAMAEKSMSNDEASSFYVEDLVYSDTDNGFAKEWQISNKYRALFADYAPSFEKNESMSIASDGSSKIKRRINERPSNPIAAKENTEIAINNSSNLADEKLAESQVEAMVSENEIVQAESVSPSVADYDFVYYDEPSIAMKDRAMAPKKMKSRLIRNSLKNFQWLLGTWEQKRDDMKSVEKWVSDSSNTIWGTGYLMQEDDTMFTENMCIKEINNKIYFFQNIDTSSELTKFVLTSEQSNSWNFSNSGGAPKNLILSNAATNYQIEIQDIAPAQTDFLRQRNVLQSNNAFRRMNKVE